MTNRRLTLALLIAPLAAAMPRPASAQAADLVVANARIFSGRAVFQKPVQ